MLYWIFGAFRKLLFSWVNLYFSVGHPWKVAPSYVWPCVHTVLRLLSLRCMCSFTPPHGLTKKTMVEQGWRQPLQCQHIMWGTSCCCLSEGTGGCCPYLPVSSLPVSLLMINQIHRPLWSVVSCYLVTSCHDLPGPLVFPWRLCAHPVIFLAALSRWPVATPGPDPQLPASLPHDPIRLSACAHVALQPLTMQHC